MTPEQIHESDPMDGPPWEGPARLEHRLDMLRACIDELRRVPITTTDDRARRAINRAMTYAQAAYPPPSKGDPHDHDRR